MTDLMHPQFLPYTPEELLTHFVPLPDESVDPERHVQKWRKRIADAPFKDASFLHRDETLWTAGALLAVHRQSNASASWRHIASQLFGPVPPTTERCEWSDLISDDLTLFFEVGLSSPHTYRQWLREHLVDRHALHTQVGAAGTRGDALEGRTQLDAMLLCESTGFALHFEAKVLSDIDTKTTHDNLRNQLARNIDCMVADPGGAAPLSKRDPDRSFLVLLTPELFRRNWSSRLYGHLIRQYMDDPATLQRDLPHLSGATCFEASRRIGWLTFEDISSVVPGACPWQELPATVAPADQVHK